jgi:two-component system sensor histidine kinase YesM
MVFQLIKKKFLSLKVNQKILLAISVLTCTTLILWIAVAFYLSGCFARAEQISIASHSISLVDAMLESSCEDLMNIARTYSAMPNIKRITADGNQGSRGFITSDMLELAENHPYFTSLALYNWAGQCIDYISLDNSNTPLLQNSSDTSRPFAALIEGTSVYAWEFLPIGSSLYMLDERSPHLNLWYPVKDFQSDSVIGVISISIDPSQLLSTSTSASTGYFVLLDQQRNVVASTYTRSDISHIASQLTSEKSYPSASSGRRFCAVSSPISDTGILLYCMVDDNVGVWLRQLMPFLIAAILCTLLLSFIPLYHFLKKYISKPLIVLNQSMEQFSKGDYSSRAHFLYNDEIGQLGSTFNNMVQKNEHLIKTAYISKIHQREAELNALQAQINPHFLYNMISAIQWTAYRNKQNEIAEMAYSLGQVFRISLNRGSNIIRVREEYELIKVYLNLQSVRFEGAFDYTLDFPEEVMDLRIPKLLMQPLVENCVVHGIDSSKSKMHIDAGIKSMDGHIHIYVNDTGKGIPPEVLEKLPAGLVGEDTAPTSHFAMRNINERLRFLFGDDYRFDISSALGSGTKIEISFPLSPYKGEE